MGRDILRTEGIWNVGNISSIQVYEDQWISTKRGFWIETQLGQSDRDAILVSALIGQSVGYKPGTTTSYTSWCSMYSSNPFVDGGTTWQASVALHKGGRWHCKINYHIIRETTDSRRAGEQTTENGSSTLWRCIWKAPTIPKIKAYIWKLATESVVVKSNFQRRGLLNNSPNCPICGENETTIHMTIDCGWMRVVWFGVLGLWNPNHNTQSICCWLEDQTKGSEISAEANQMRWAMCMTTCCYICKARCKAMFEAKIPHRRPHLRR